MVAVSRDSKLPTKPLVAILLGAPLTAQNYKRTGIPYLAAHFDVVVLDCNRWVRKGYDSVRFVKHDYAHVIPVSSAAEFAAAIARLKPAYAIDFIGLDAQTRFIQTTLREHGTLFVVQKTGPLPVTPTNTARALALLAKHPSLFLQKLVRRLKNLRRKPLAPDVALLAGKRSLDSFTRRAPTILWIGSLDYHTYRAARASSADGDLSPPLPRRYALFIDDCIAVASDYVLMGVSPPVNPDRYFVLLRQCFDRLERVTGLPIVVAAHPNGRVISGYTSLFGDRPVYFDRTAELCARSEMVISHVSTALSYAALGSKAVLILTCTELDKSSYGSSVRETSAQLRCPMLFMESDDAAYRAAVGRSKVDVDAYRTYVENFVVAPDVAEDAPWQAFIDFVRRDWTAAKSPLDSRTPSRKP